MLSDSEQAVFAKAGSIIPIQLFKQDPDELIVTEDK